MQESLRKNRILSLNYFKTFSNVLEKEIINFLDASCFRSFGGLCFRHGS